MKNKLMRILGIALTLAVLVGMLLPAMPASAGTMSWTDVPMPTQLTENTNLSMVTFAADGKTVFAISTDGEGTQTLIKSTDAGISWLPPDKVGDGLIFIDNVEDTTGVDVVALAVSPRYATDSIVVAVGDDNLFYYSDNGGKSFATDQIDLPDGIGTITSVAIAYNWDDVLAIALGTTDGVLVSIGSAFRVNTTDAGMTDPTYAVAFAPDYDSSDKVLALVDNETTGDITIQVAAIAGKTNIAGAVWRTKATFPISDTDGADLFYAIDSGFMAFPADYSSDDNAIVFVALNSDEEADSNAFRTDLNGDSGIATNLRLNKKFIAEGFNDIFSLAYNGDAEEGTLAVGLGDKIWTSTNADTVDGSATWIKPKKLATGEMFDVVFVNDMLYVASSNYGDSSTGSAFSVSVADLAGYNGLSRISVNSLEYGDINFDKYSGAGKATQYILVKSGVAEILMKTTDSGKTWQEIFAEADSGEESINGISINGDTMYITFKGSEIIKKSTDGGNTFAPPITLRRVIDTFALVDANTYFYAANGQEIYKSTADRLPVATLDTTANIFVMITIPGFFVVKTMGGPIFFSGDSGVTFKKLGDLEPVDVTFDVPGRMIYAVDDANTLWSYNVDTSNDWAKGKEIAPIDGDVAAIALSNDGAMYARVDVDGNDLPQLYRSVDIKGPNSFEAIPASSIDDVDNLGGILGTKGPINLSSGTDGNTIYGIFKLDGQPAAGKGLAVKVKTFTDTMVTAPAIIAPAANAQVSPQPNPTFTWGSVNGGTNPVTYELEWGSLLDAGGKIIVMSDAETKGTSLNSQGFEAGQSYYWHVRALGDGAKTLSSKWSAPTQFIVKFGDVNPGDNTWIAPAAGASGVSQTPSFQWPSVAGATGYELVIDGGTAIKLTTTVYVPTTPFAYGSTHTWQVRAINGTTQGEWISSVFTVMAAPPAPTTTPPPAPKFFDPNSGQYFDSQAQLDAFQAQWKINHPAPVAPSTPAYIWVIIVIGAILVIAVIVLIARTRRV